jgi:hypothetical protein
MKENIRWYRHYIWYVASWYWSIEREKNPKKWDEAKKVSTLIYAEKIEIY